MSRVIYISLEISKFPPIVITSPNRFQVKISNFIQLSFCLELILLFDPLGNMYIGSRLDHIRV